MLIGPTNGMVLLSYGKVVHDYSTMTTVKTQKETGMTKEVTVVAQKAARIS